MAQEKSLRASQRFSNTTPEGLRLRVLSAIPVWEKIPRKIRQAITMLPVYGDWEDACEAVGADIKKTPAEVKVIVANWKKTGNFPDQVRVKTARKRGEKRETFEVRAPLTQAEMLQQLANEMASIALIKAEGSLRGGDALKLATTSGWFLNLEAEVEKSRAYTDHRIGKAIGNLGKTSASEKPEESGVPEFEQDMDVDDDFSGETTKAQEQREPAASDGFADEHIEDEIESDVVQAVSMAGKGS
jgi:hypothetical protein